RRAILFGRLVDAVTYGDSSKIVRGHAAKFRVQFTAIAAFGKMLLQLVKLSARQFSNGGESTEFLIPVVIRVLRIRIRMHHPSPTLCSPSPASGWFRLSTSSAVLSGLCNSNFL